MLGEQKEASQPASATLIRGANSRAQSPTTGTTGGGDITSGRGREHTLREWAELLTEELIEIQSRVSSALHSGVGGGGGEKGRGGAGGGK